MIIDTEQIYIYEYENDNVTPIYFLDSITSEEKILDLKEKILEIID